MKIKLIYNNVFKYIIRHDYTITHNEWQCSHLYIESVGTQPIQMQADQECDISGLNNTSSTAISYILFQNGE